VLSSANEPVAEKPNTRPRITRKNTDLKTKLVLSYLFICFIRGRLH
jgi:hypothetical protein